MERLLLIPRPQAMVQTESCELDSDSELRKRSSRRLRCALQRCCGGAESDYLPGNEQAAPCHTTTTSAYDTQSWADAVARSVRHCAYKGPQLKKCHGIEKLKCDFACTSSSSYPRNMETQLAVCNIGQTIKACISIPSAYPYIKPNSDSSPSSAFPPTSQPPCTPDCS